MEVLQQMKRANTAKVQRHSTWMTTGRGAWSGCRGTRCRVVVGRGGWRGVVGGRGGWHGVVTGSGWRGVVGGEGGRQCVLAEREVVGHIPTVVGGSGRSSTVGGRWGGGWAVGGWGGRGGVRPELGRRGWRLS